MCACDFNYTCSRCYETRADDPWVDWQEQEPVEPFSAEPSGA